MSDLADHALSRREAVIRLARALLAGAAAAGIAPAAATRCILEGGLPPTGDPERPSFEVFYALSRLVTCRDALDLAAARKLYAEFMREPWGPKHMATAFAEIARRLRDGRATSAAGIIESGVLGSGERWFVSHLVVTWYLGIYYHERGTQRLLYAEALMWDPVRDVTNVFALTTGGPGSWGEPPPGAARRDKG